METKRTIKEKLLEFQCNIETIKKDGKNEFFKKSNGKASTYATLPNILSEVKPILNALKIVLTQPIINNEVFTVLTCSETGETSQSGINLPANLNAQQTGSAITYFRRYTLCSLLALEIDEDDDGNAATGNTGAPTAKSPELPWLNENSPQFAEAIKFLMEGGSIDKIEKKYKLSKKTRESLLSKAV